MTSDQLSKVEEVSNRKRLRKGKDAHEELDENTDRKEQTVLRDVGTHRKSEMLEEEVVVGEKGAGLEDEKESVAFEVRYRKARELERTARRRKSCCMQ